jgi:hypothetical protein
MTFLTSSSARGLQRADWIQKWFFRLHFGKRNCTWKGTCQSAPLIVLELELVLEHGATSRYTSLY